MDHEEAAIQVRSRFTSCFQTTSPHSLDNILGKTVVYGLTHVTLPLELFREDTEEDTL